MFKKDCKVFMIVLVVLTLAGSGVMPVLAADESEPEAAPAAPIKDEGVRRFFSGMLARTFRYQKSMVIFIGDALEGASDSANKAKDRIAELDEQGKDVSALEEAMVSFETLYALAATDQQAALALVDEHEGFDLNGKVRELAAARKTVKSIEPHLSNARETMIEAIRAINRALHAHRDATPGSF